MDIRIDSGVYTQIEVDLSQFVFNGISTVVMTAKNSLCGDVIFVRDFTSAGKYIISITPAEAEKLVDGAVFDFDIITTDGRRYKNGSNGSIQIRKGVGRCSDSN